MMMRKTLLTVVAAVIAFTCAPTPAQSAPNIIFFRGDTYAAIAYSPKTGKYGYAYGQSTRDMAEGIAKRRCKAADAKVVTWVHNGWCALAIGENGTYGVGWSYGNGATNRDAKLNALDECQKRSKKARLLLCVCSIDRQPEIFDKD